MTAVIITGGNEEVRRRSRKTDGGEDGRSGWLSTNHHGLFLNTTKLKTHDVLWKDVTVRRDMLHVSGSNNRSKLMHFDVDMKIKDVERQPIIHIQTHIDWKSACEGELFMWSYIFRGDKSANSTFCPPTSKEQLRGGT